MNNFNSTEFTNFIARAYNLPQDVLEDAFDVTDNIEDRNITVMYYAFYVFLTEIKNIDIDELTDAEIDIKFKEYYTEFLAYALELTFTYSDEE